MYTVLAIVLNVMYTVLAIVLYNYIANVMHFACMQDHIRTCKNRLPITETAASEGHQERAEYVFEKLRTSGIQPPKEKSGVLLQGGCCGCCKKKKGTVYYNEVYYIAYYHQHAYATDNKDGAATGCSAVSGGAATRASGYLLYSS